MNKNLINKKLRGPPHFPYASPTHYHMPPSLPPRHFVLFLSFFSLSILVTDWLVTASHPPIAATPIREEEIHSRGSPVGARSREEEIHSRGSPVGARSDLPSEESDITRSLSQIGGGVEMEAHAGDWSSR